MKISDIKALIARDGIKTVRHYLGPFIGRKDIKTAIVRGMEGTAIGISYAPFESFSMTNFTPYSCSNRPLK